MYVLQDYLDIADNEPKRDQLRAQWKTATTEGVIYCDCGIPRHITLAFRCLYCGEWYCGRCAQIHFGMTMQQWIEKKRIESRLRVYEQKKNVKFMKYIIVNHVGRQMPILFPRELDSNVVGHPYAVASQGLAEIAVTATGSFEVKVQNDPDPIAFECRSVDAEIIVTALRERA